MGTTGNTRAQISPSNRIARSHRSSRFLHSGHPKNIRQTVFIGMFPPGRLAAARLMLRRNLSLLRYL